MKYFLAILLLATVVAARYWTNEEWPDYKVISPIQFSSKFTYLLNYLNRNNLAKNTSLKRMPRGSKYGKEDWRLFMKTIKRIQLLTWLEN